jgi:putative polyhydroxyalkanoate system protein
MHDAAVRLRSGHRLGHHATHCHPTVRNAMATIDIRRPHKISLKAAKAAVERVAKGIAKEYGIAHEWSGNQLKFDRSGVKGHIAVAKDEVHVHVELGFLMGALKSVIEREINSQLDEHIP